MFIRVLRHLFGAYAALPFLVILSSHHSCSATKNTSNYCAPSCGNIRNISYPFRLNTDPQSCGNKSFELACENNERPTLYLDKVKYYVQAINYSDFTIRLVDAAVQKDDCFSIPHHSFTKEYSPRSADGNYYYDINWPFNISVLTFLCCKNQNPNPPGYIMDASSCKNGSGTEYISSPSCVDMEGHAYVMVDGNVQDVPDLCRIDLIYSMPKYMTNKSYTDVHDILVYGFELSWFYFCCHYGTENNRCNLDEATVKNNNCLQYPLSSESHTGWKLFFEGEDCYGLTCSTKRYIYSAFSSRMSVFVFFYLLINHQDFAR
jgi:hypothetical protein